MRPILAFGALATLTHPAFFALYRLSVFSTVPRDDYAPFLLWLLRQPGGALPDSPYCYRVLSVAVAAPFYYALPSIPLTSVPAGLSLPYLQATAAVSMVAFLTWVAAAMLGYATALQAGLGRVEGVIAGVLLSAFILYTQITAVDPLVIALIAAGIWLVDRRWAFAALLAVAVVTNEKAILVLGCWLVTRCALSRDDRAALGWQAMASVLAFGCYIAMVKLVQLPGNPYQLEPAYFPTTIRENLAAYVTPRGLFLNVLPIAVLAGVAVLGRPIGVFRRRDALVIPMLAAIALVLTHLFQAGRIVMHAGPLYAVPAAAALCGWLDRRRRDTTGRASPREPTAHAPESAP